MDIVELGAGASKDTRRHSAKTIPSLTQKDLKEIGGRLGGG